jgi:hypothetical protein
MEKGPQREVLIDTADDGVGCDHIVVGVEQWEARSGFHIPAGDKGRPGRRKPIGTTYSTVWALSHYRKTSSS